MTLHDIILKALEGRRVTVNAVSRAPMNVEGEAQVEAGSGEDCDRVAMLPDRRADRGITCRFSWTATTCAA